MIVEYVIRNGVVRVDDEDIPRLDTEKWYKVSSGYIFNFAS